MLATHCGRCAKWRWNHRYRVLSILQNSSPCPFLYSNRCLPSNNTYSTYVVLLLAAAMNNFIGLLIKAILDEIDKHR
uniref:Ion_trans domain-containing protein n=1 Tax=Ascaris lumbricoides TaxID=6252 RepID=A0A0M3I8B5_ASCLU